MSWYSTGQLRFSALAIAACACIVGTPALAKPPDSVAQAAAGSGSEKKGNHCTEEDRKYADFWDNYYDPEDAYQFGEKIQNIVREKNLGELFSLARGGELYGFRASYLKGKEFDDIFPEPWGESNLDMEPPCSPVGSRGFMLGQFWFDRVGEQWFITAISGGRQERYFDSSAFAGWKIREGLIPPHCFVTEWSSSDNFEELEDIFSIPKNDCWSPSEGLTFCKSKDFRSNPGRYFGKEIASLEPVRPSWSDSDLLFITMPVDDCFGGPRLKVTVEHNFVEEKVCSDRWGRSCWTESYHVLARIPIKKCEALAPNFSGRCEESFLLTHSRDFGGTMGPTTTFGIYGLFVSSRGERFILPLKYLDDLNSSASFYESLDK